MSDSLNPDDKEFWKDAVTIDEKTLDSKEFWKDAQFLTDEQVAVFDERNVRAVSVPMSLKGYEADYMIKRDVDGIKRFWGQQDINEIESVWRGIATGTVLNIPQVVGGLMQQIGEVGGKLEKPDLPDFVQKVFDYNNKLVNKLGGYDAIAEQGKSLVKRNKKWLADIGYDRSENHPIIYDLASGAGSLLQSIGLYRITKGAAAPLAFTGAKANAQAYLESRDAGATPDKSSFIAAQRGAVEAALEKTGLDWFMKGIASNTMVKKFAIGFWSEFFQESTQAGAEEGIMQGYGVRDKELKKTFQDILYQGAIGGVVGGGGSVAIGAFVKDQAEQRGLPKDLADKLATYAQKNAYMIDENLTEFLDKEVSPLVDSDPNSAKFMQLAKNPDLKYEDLDETDKQIYDDFMAAFNSSLKDDTAVSKVEKSFYTMAIENGVREDWAAANSKLIGKYADYAGRALGVSPEEWFSALNLEIAVDKTGAPSVSMLSDGDIRLNTLRTIAVRNKTLDEKKKSRFAKRMADYEKAVKDNFGGDYSMAARAGVNKPKTGSGLVKMTGSKYPVLNYLKKIGGINPDGFLAKELRAMDITPKRFLFAFSKKGIDDADNIPVDEITGYLGGSVSIEEENGYATRNWILDAIRSEVSGSPVVAREEIAANISEEDAEIQSLQDDYGVDLTTMTNDQVRDAIATKTGDVRYQQGGSEFDQRGSHPTLEELQGRWVGKDYGGVETSIYETDKGILLGKIDVDAGKQGQGHGSRVMQELADYADRTGRRVLLSPSTDFGATSVGRLKKFYKRFGFVENKGRNKDFSTQEDMYREPKPLAQKANTFDQEANGNTSYSDPTITVDGVERSTTNSKGQPIAATKEGLENFWRWFGDSKVVDADGKPLVVYHGTKADFDTFDLDKVGQNGMALGAGFYFSDAQSVASGYGKTLELYLRAENPTFSNQKKTITKAQAKSIISALEKEDEYFLSNYGDIESEGRPAVLRSALDDIYDSSENDADVITAIINVGGIERDTVMQAVVNATGKDGFVVDAGIDSLAADGSQKVYTVLLPTQIKSATGNRGTFSPDNANILYQDEVSARGQTEFYSSGRKLITLFEGNANASTLPHELAHVFLRDFKRIGETTTRATVRADWQAVKRFLNIKGNEKMTVAQEEKFARAYELFLRQGYGKAPEMKSVFERFKNWIKGVYKTVDELNVKLTPEIIAVFDKMTGAGYSVESQKKAKALAAKEEAEYEKIAEKDYRPKERVMKDFFASAGDILSVAAAPLSTRLRAVNETIMHKLRRFDFDVRISTMRDGERVKGFLEGVSKSKMSASEYRVLDLALKNNNAEKANEILEKYGLQDEFRKVREVLDGIYTRATAGGIDVGYLHDYFPRYIRPDKAGDYLAYVMGQNPEAYSRIEIDMRLADPENKMTQEQKAEYVNKWLRGFQSNKIMSAKSSFEKERSVKLVTAETSHFYDDSMNTLTRYIRNMNERIEITKFFGKDKDQLDESIGEFARKMVDEKFLSSDQEQEISRVLRSYFSNRGVTGALANIRDIGYITTMGNFISTITQFGDLAFSLVKNGYFNTLGNLAKATVGKSEITRDSLGIDNIIAEYQDTTRTSELLNSVFKIVGMNRVNRIMQNTFINSAMNRLQKRAINSADKFEADMLTIFGDQTVAAQVTSDFQKGNLTDDVNYILFSEILDVQPIALTEMPEGYVSGGNYRILYMLKTYTIKQWDIYRRDVVWKIKNPETRVEGIRNLVSMFVALMLCNMAADEAKDFLLGRDTEFSDTVVLNMIRVSGLTKYNVVEAQREGVLNMILKNALMPTATVSVFSDFQKDIQKVFRDKKPLSFEDMRVWARVPVVGKFYYYWFGGGKDD